MPTLVQTASNAVTTAGGTVSVSATFGSPVTAGNTIVVSVGAVANGFSGLNNCSTPSVADTLSNTYTQAVWNDSAYQSGGSCGLFFAASPSGGSDTVTFTFVATTSGGPTYSYGLTIAEYSGLPSCSVPAGGSAVHPIFGIGGNTQVNLGITDSNSTPVTVTFGGSAGSGGPGTNCCLAIADLLSGGKNYLFAAVRNGASPTATSSYTTFTDRVSVASPMIMDFFDSAPGVATITQPQVCVVT